MTRTHKLGDTGNARNHALNKQCRAVSCSVVARDCDLVDEDIIIHNEKELCVWEALVEASRNISEQKGGIQIEHTAYF